MATHIERKEQLTLERRKQILGAALKVFSDRGYGESTMAEVAEEAGVGVGTLYNYYENKDDLLLAIVQNLIVSEGLTSIMSSMDGQGDAHFMNSFLKDRLGFAMGNAQPILFLLFEIQRDPKLRKQYIRQVIGPGIAALEDFIRLQIKKGAFREVDEKIVARTIVGSIIGNALLYRLEQRDSPLSKSRLGEAACEISGLFLRGMEKA